MGFTSKIESSYFYIKLIIIYKFFAFDKNNNTDYNIYMKCNICPRQCNIDRNKNVGFCNQFAKFR